MYLPTSYVTDVHLVSYMVRVRLVSYVRTCTTNMYKFIRTVRGQFVYINESQAVYRMIKY